MKKIKYTLASLFWAILCLPILISAQENQSSQWIRVQSDNGEFSIESPVGYDFYGDKDGFSVSSGNSYQLTEMRMLNCYHEKTLMSFETYKTDSPKEVADILADRDGENGEKSVNKIGKSKIRQVLIKNENFYAVRRFYVPKDYLYVLTAASREGETASIKRFLNSLAFKTSELQIEPAQVIDSNVKTVLFSNLKFSQLEI